jgi:hypothetical protein
MKRYGKRAAAAATALALSGLLAPTASADTTLTLFERDDVQNVVDHGEPGPGPGDQFLFAGDVFDRPGGVVLGRSSGACTTLTGNGQAGQTTCSATFDLAGGQILVQGYVDSAALFVTGDTNPLAITGGTGVYRNARGDGTIRVPVDVPNQTDAYFVLNVIDG